MDNIEKERLLLELGKTEEDLSLMWKHCQIGGHTLISSLGNNWQDQEYRLIKKLPKIYERLSMRMIHGSDYYLRQLEKSRKKVC